MRAQISWTTINTTSVGHSSQSTEKPKWAPAEPGPEAKREPLQIEAAKQAASADAGGNQADLPVYRSQLEVVDFDHAVALHVYDLTIEHRGGEQDLVLTEGHRGDLCGFLIEGDRLRGDAADGAPRERRGSALASLPDEQFRHRREGFARPHGDIHDPADESPVAVHHAHSQQIAQVGLCEEDHRRASFPHRACPRWGPPRLS